MAGEALTPGIVGPREPRLRPSNEPAQLDPAGFVEPFPDIEIGRHLPGVSATREGGISIREGHAAVVADKRSARDSLTPCDLPRDPRVGADLHLSVAAPEAIRAGPGLVLQECPAYGEERSNGLPETTAHSRALFDGPASFVFHLDRHRLPVKLAAVHQRAVVPDTGDGPHEKESSLHLLRAEIAAALLPHTHEREAGVPVPDNERHLNASLKDVAVAQVIERSSRRANLVSHMHVARRGPERGQGPSRIRRSGGTTQADLGPIESPMEGGQLHFVDGDRKVPDGGAERFALDGEEEASASGSAVRDRARVSVDGVEAIGIKVDQETIAAGVVEVLEELPELPPAGVERRADQVAARDPAFQVIRKASLGPDALALPGSTEGGTGRLPDDTVGERDEEEALRADIDGPIDLPRCPSASSTASFKLLFPSGNVTVPEKAPSSSTWSDSAFAHTR